MQLTDTLLMVRPAQFGYNAETAVSNAFQSVPEGSGEAINAQAQKEFDDFVDLLQSNGITVHVVQDSQHPSKPDAVFPNNWISVNRDGSSVLYPMLSEARRLERQQPIIDVVQGLTGQSEVYDWSHFEAENHYLEGTGSMVLDHVNKRLYACRSARTHECVVTQWAATFNYQPIIFDAIDRNGVPVYHTNVLMSIGEEFLVICLEAIPSAAQRKWLINHFNDTPHMVIPITLEQMESFAGNILQLRNANDERLIVLSQAAYNSLGEVQLNRLYGHGKLLVAELSTIERYGGGSARCMMAELFGVPSAVTQ